MFQTVFIHLAIMYLLYHHLLIPHTHSTGCMELTHQVTYPMVCRLVGLKSYQVTHVLATWDLLQEDYNQGCLKDSMATQHGIVLERQLATQLLGYL